CCGPTWPTARFRIFPCTAPATGIGHKWRVTARRSNCCVHSRLGAGPKMRVMDGTADTNSPTDAANHLAAAAMARAAGDVDAMRAALVAAFAAARAAGDGEAMAAAALAMPSGQCFGVYPGQIPALLHEAYSAADTKL